MLSAEMKTPDGTADRMSATPSVQNERAPFLIFQTASKGDSGKGMSNGRGKLPTNPNTRANIMSGFMEPAIRVELMTY